MKTHITLSPVFFKHCDIHASLVGHEVNLLGCCLHLFKVWNRIEKNRKYQFIIQRSVPPHETCLQYPCVCMIDVNVFLWCVRKFKTQIWFNYLFFEWGRVKNTIDLSSQECTASRFRSQTKTIQSQHLIHLFHPVHVMDRKCFRLNALGVAGNIQLWENGRPVVNFFIFSAKKGGEVIVVWGNGQQVSDPHQFGLKVGGSGLSQPPHSQEFPPTS